MTITDSTFFEPATPDEPLTPRLAALRDNVDPNGGRRRADRIADLEARARLITNVLDDIERYRRHAYEAPVTNRDVVVMMDGVIRREVRRLAAQRREVVDLIALLRRNPT